jgi:hypothetical protein
MNRNDIKTAFPGAKKGIVRVFIKRTAREDSAQLHFHFPDKKLEQN